MDIRAAIPIAITAKRRNIITRFNDVLSETMWSRVYPLAAMQDRQKITSETIKLTPETAAENIADLRLYLDEKAKYWDAKNLEKRAVLMALFDINIFLIEVHKNINSLNESVLKDFLITLEGDFTKLDLLPKKNYKKLIDGLQPIIQTLFIFKSKLEPAVPIPNISIQVEKKEEAKPLVHTADPDSPLELKEKTKLHPALNKVLKRLQLVRKALNINPDLPTDEKLREKEINKNPLIKKGKKAIRNLNQLLHLYPTFPPGMPKFLKVEQDAFKDFHNYFDNINAWAKKLIEAKQSPPAAENSEPEPAKASAPLPIAIPISKTSDLKTETASIVPTATIEAKSSPKESKLEAKQFITFSPIAIFTLRWKLDQLISGRLEVLRNSLSLSHGADLRSSHLSLVSKISSLIDQLQILLGSSSPKSATATYDLLCSEISLHACTMESGPEPTQGTKKIKELSQTIYSIALLKTKISGFVYPSRELSLPIIPSEIDLLDPWLATTGRIVDAELVKETEKTQALFFSEHKALSFPDSPRAEVKKNLQIKTQEKKSFWSRHPYLKWGAIGFGLSLLGGVILVAAGYLSLLALPLLVIGTSLFSAGIRKSLDSYCKRNNSVDETSEISPRNPEDTMLDRDETECDYSRLPDASPKARSAPARSSPRAQLFFPTEVKTKSPTTQEDIYKAIKELICPDNKLERDKLLSFWSACDNKETIKKRITLLIDKHHITLPEAIGCLAQLVTQAVTSTQKTSVSTLAMQNSAIKQEAIKNVTPKKDQGSFYKVTEENLAATIEEYGYKKTICSIVAYRYTDIAEKGSLLKLLLQAIKSSPDYDSKKIVTGEKIGDLAALRTTLGARVL